MHDLTPIAPLGGTAPREDVVGTLTLTERPDVALASVAARLGREAEVRGHLTDLLGRAPGPGEAVQGDPETGFWTGPDQWMVDAPHDTHEDLADRLEARMGEAASVTEQTDAWACLDLRGEAMEEAMARLCALDLPSMAPGTAQRTTIHHVGCFVIRRDPPDGTRIVGPRASAGSLHHAILGAMRSVA